MENVLQILQDFEAMSGLAISREKTSFYIAGFSDQKANQIATATGLTHGTLPIRYLGLPLCTKKLTIIDYVPLIKKVKSRISTWTARSLSFAGRLQLLNYVIAGISNFWCSSIILPKKCITTLNSMCGPFMWKGSIEGHHSARVS